MRAERLALGIAGLALASPATRWIAEQLGQQQSLCPILRATGVPCPSCGGTRAAAHLLSGDPLAAFSVNTGATMFMVTVGVLLLAGVLHGSTLWALIGPEPIDPASLSSRGSGFAPANSAAGNSPR